MSTVIKCEAGKGFVTCFSAVTPAPDPARLVHRFLIQVEVDPSWWRIPPSREDQITCLEQFFADAVQGAFACCDPLKVFPELPRLEVRREP
jgi:hypothetical protein